jgi:hypothetical protein
VRFLGFLLSLVCFLDAVNFWFSCKLASGKQAILDLQLPIQLWKLLTYLVHDRKKISS